MRDSCESYGLTAAFRLPSPGASWRSQGGKEELAPLSGLAHARSSSLPQAGPGPTRGVRRGGLLTKRCAAQRKMNAVELKWPAAIYATLIKIDLERIRGARRFATLPKKGPQGFPATTLSMIRRPPKRNYPVSAILV